MRTHKAHLETDEGKNMKRFLKRLGQLILVVAVLIAIAYPFRRDPIAMIPGKQLSGEEKAYPADWEFTNDHMLVKVESRPEDPYSVTTICFLIDGNLHIPAQKGSTKKWPENVVADPYEIVAWVYPPLTL